MPLRDVYLNRSEPMLKMESELNQRKGEVVKEARLDGIRPMPIERLLELPRIRHQHPGHRPARGGERVRDPAPDRQAPADDSGGGLVPSVAAPSTSAPSEEKKADEDEGDIPKKKSDTAKKKADDEGNDQ